MPQLTQKAKKPPKAHSSEHMHRKGVARPPSFLRDAVPPARACPRSPSRALTRVRFCVRTGCSEKMHVFHRSMHVHASQNGQSLRNAVRHAQNPRSRAWILHAVGGWRTSPYPRSHTSVKNRKKFPVTCPVCEKVAFANRDARQRAHRIAMLVPMMATSAFRAPTHAPNQAHTKRPAAGFRRGPWLQKRSARAGASSGSRR